MAFLAAIPPPGLPVFPGYQAVKPEHFVIKENNKHFTRDSHTVSFSDNFGNIGQQFLEIDESKRNHLSFKAAGGAEVMRIIREKHSLSPTIYHGLGRDGREIWRLELKRHSFSGTDYNLSVNSNGRSVRLPVENKIMGKSKGILFNGQPVATLGEESSMHLRREEHVYVAPGMDILIALGVAWVHVDKQNEDTKQAVAAAT